MKQQKLLLKVVYGYISLAFAAILFDTMNIFHPIANIFAGIWLLIACWYIGKYGHIEK